MKTRRSTRLGAGVLAVLFGLTGSASAQEDQESIIKYRQALMSAQSGHLGGMFQIAGGKAGKWEHMKAHAHGLLEVSKMAGDAFRTPTDGGKTRAKPAIWEEWKAFEDRNADMVRVATELLQAVESGDNEAITAKLDEAGDVCGDCHRKYRTKRQ